MSERYLLNADSSQTAIHGGYFPPAGTFGPHKHRSITVSGTFVQHYIEVFEMSVEASKNEQCFTLFATAVLSKSYPSGLLKADMRNCEKGFSLSAALFSYNGDIEKAKKKI